MAATGEVLAVAAKRKSAALVVVDVDSAGTSLALNMGSRGSHQPDPRTGTHKAARGQAGMAAKRVSAALVVEDGNGAGTGIALVMGREARSNPVREPGPTEQHGAKQAWPQRELAQYWSERT